MYLLKALKVQDGWVGGEVGGGERGRSNAKNEIRLVIVFFVQRLSRIKKFDSWLKK